MLTGILILLLKRLLILSVIRPSQASFSTFQQAAEDRIITRHNMGVQFIHHGMILGHSDTYFHNTIIELRPEQNVSNLNNTNNRTKGINSRYIDSLGSGTSSLSAIEEALTMERNLLKRLITDINNVFPNVDEQQPTRNKRTWCLFFCSGIAEDRDLKIIAAFSANASRVSADNFKILQTALSNIVSLSINTESKFQAVNKIMERQQHNDIIRDRFAQTMQHWISGLVNVLLPNMAELQKLHNSLLLLKHKILTYDILPYKYANHIMNGVKQHLSHYTGKYLVDPHPMHLYTNTDFSVYRSNGTLHLILKIKLGPFKTPMHLFRSEVYDTNFPNGKHDIELQAIPRYVLINDAENLYLTFKNKPTLINNLYYDMQLQEHSIHSKSEPTCVLALLIDDVVLIKEKCRSFLKHAKQESSIKNLGKNMVLFNNITSFILITDDTVNVVESECEYCIKTLPCDTQLQAGSQVILMDSCTPQAISDQSNDTLFTINLQLLAPFLDQNTLLKFSSGEYFTNNIIFQMENFTNGTLNQDVREAFSQLQMDTSQFINGINQTLQEGIVLKPHIDFSKYQWNDKSYQHTARDYWNSFVQYVTHPFAELIAKGLTILQAASIIYLLYRTHTMNIMIMALSVRGTNAVTQISTDLVRKRLMSTAIDPTDGASQNTGEYTSVDQNISAITSVLKQTGFLIAENAKISMENLPFISQELHLLDLAIWFTLILIAIYIIIRFAKNKLEINSTFLYADFSNQHYRTFIKIGKLPYSSEMYEFTASSFVDSVRITADWLPILNIHWPTLEIQNKILKSKNSIVFSAKLDPLNAYKMKRILHNGFDLLIFTRNSNSTKFQVLSLKGTSWERIQNSADSQNYYV